MIAEGRLFGPKQNLKVPQQEVMNFEPFDTPDGELHVGHTAGTLPEANGEYITLWGERERGSVVGSVVGTVSSHRK